MVEAMFGGPATGGCRTCNYVPDSETNADGLIDPDGFTEGYSR